MSAIDDYLASFHEDPGYLNWAAFGPMSPAARAALATDADLLATGRPEGIAEVGRRGPEARAEIAALVGSAPDDVTLHASTSHGLQHALAGLDGTVVASSAEFPSITITLARAADASHGRLAPRWIMPVGGRVTADAVRAALDPAVTALVVSHVDFRSGYRADLAALREVLGPDRLLIIDTAQSYGAIDADWSLADVVVGHGYKWLRAGRGTGFARFTARARERIRPVLSGFTGTVVPGLPADEVPDPAPSGQAYAVSPPDSFAAGRLAVAAAELRAVRARSVMERLSHNVDAVLEIADRHRIPVTSPRSAAERAGLVMLAPADPEGFGGVLAAAGVRVTVRSGAVRVAPHAGTTPETLALFDDAVAGAGEFIAP